MRWENLFSDLEGQLEYGLTAEHDDVEAEEERLRLGRLTVRDRILSLSAVAENGVQQPVSLHLDGGHSISVRTRTVGRDWLAADVEGAPASGRQCIVPIAAIRGISLSRRQLRRSLEPRPARATGSLEDRLGLPFLLRDLCRRRTAVEMVLRDETFFGTIDRVGRDHVDIAVHEPGTPRRDSEVRALRIIALAALVLIRL